MNPYILVALVSAIIFLPMAFFLGISAYIKVLLLIAGLVLFIVIMIYFYWKLVVQQ